MAGATTATSKVRRLAAELLDGADGDDLEELLDWLSGSRRFRAFAGTYRDKIRKKLRGASDFDARRDVRAELRVAHLLLADPRIDLAFEAYGSAAGGPDFTVTLRGERSFNLEVTRPRRAPDALGLAGPMLPKLRQLPPSVPNVLLVAIEGATAAAFDVTASVRAVRARADAKDDAFFTARGFDGARGFYQRFLRLGAVIVWCERASGDDRAAWWTNGSARIAVPERAIRASLACLREGSR